jgi:hypothetical protein
MLIITVRLLITYSVWIKISDIVEIKNSINLIKKYYALLEEIRLKFHDFHQNYNI